MPAMAPQTMTDEIEIAVGDPREAGAAALLTASNALMEALFDPIFKDKDAPFYLVCGAGGQAALTGKTMKEMGFTNVTNIGGFPGWKDAGGPTES